MTNRPLCFVLMPFGEKKDPRSGAVFDFDAIYDKGIRLGIEAAGMEPIRADEERTGGIIHKPMFERLMLCEYAVADLTTANANVFYELGVRHAVRPSTTLSIFAEDQSPPFDVNYLRGLPYDSGGADGFGDDQAAALATGVGKRLRELREEKVAGDAVDSPIFQLLTEYEPPEIAHLKTDVFRQQVEYSAERKKELAKARRGKDPAGLKAIENGLGDLDGIEAGVVLDLYLSYRAIGDWDAMVELQERMPVVLRNTTMVREQLGFALNRRGDRDEALDVLEDVLERQGPSSETCGLIGRIYKDKWKEARENGPAIVARGFLDKAIDAYVRGFHVDSRDFYPGINAVTLLDLKGDEESLAHRDALLPVVRFAVDRRLESKSPNYWDHATLLELGVLGSDEEQAVEALTQGLAETEEYWEPETTADNLRLIQGARKERGLEQAWLGEVIEALDYKAGELRP